MFTQENCLPPPKEEYLGAARTVFPLSFLDHGQVPKKAVPLTALPKPVRKELIRAVTLMVDDQIPLMQLLVNAKGQIFQAVMRDPYCITSRDDYAFQIQVGNEIQVDRRYHTEVLVRKQGRGRQ